MTNTKEVLQAQFAALSKKIKAGTQAFNSKNFTASVRVIGFDNDTDNLFDHDFIVDFNDPEIVKFFEQYTTRLAADRELISQQLIKM